MGGAHAKCTGEGHTTSNGEQMNQQRKQQEAVQLLSATHNSAIVGLFANAQQTRV